MSTAMRSKRSRGPLDGESSGGGSTCKRRRYPACTSALGKREVVDLTGAVPRVYKRARRCDIEEAPAPAPDLWETNLMLHQLRLEREARHPPRRPGPPAGAYNAALL